MANLAHVDTTLVTSGCGYIEIARGRIEFQFMPRVGSDDRSPTWEDEVMPEQAESLPIYMGGTSRKISISFVYIVTDIFGGWNIQKIRDQLSLIRGYVHEARLANDARNLVGRIKLWGVGGSKPITCRIDKCSIKHGQQYIASDSSPRTTIPATGAAPSGDGGSSGSEVDQMLSKQINSGAGTFPLRTDVTLDIALWTNADGEFDGVAAGLDHGVTVDWY